MRGSHDSDQYKDKAIFNYVLELDSFYERLLLIIKCLTPLGKEDNNDVTKWLKDNNNYQYTQFKDATAKSHNLIRKAANGIKHDTSAVDYLTINNHDDIEIKGFYFSNIVGEDELIGPAPEIQETYKGSSTAFSYDYFIRYTGGFVASCIYHLNNILFKGKKYEPIKIEILYSF